MTIGIRDEETGEERSWDIPDWIVIVVLSGIVTGLLLMVI